MAGSYGFAMEQKDIVRLLITTVGSFIKDRLVSKEQRTQHKEQCAERIAAEDGSCDKDTEVLYSDQAVLANLDWGIEALEEAIDTSNTETKLARLDHAEKMLQVCAMLNSYQRTAGVPNFYLSAWAHLYLSYLWKLRNNTENSVLHVLEMFIIDPFFSRIDFAPELWKDLFLPHTSSIVGWYSEARQRLMMEVIPDSSDLSFTANLDQFFNESLIYSMRPDQLEKLQKLEELYGESLDEKTRLFAKYYKDCMNSNSTARKKMVPMLPIAEPPVTPLHEVSRSIPDYVKFGPILPQSAGFSPVLRYKHAARAESRLGIISSLSPNLEESSATCDPREGKPEDRGNDSDCEPSDTYFDSEDKNNKLTTLPSIKSTENKDIGVSKRPSKAKSQKHSPKICSPMDSPRISPKIISPNSVVQSKRKLKTILRILSCRAMDSAIATSLPDSPCMRKEHSSSSPDSDGEVIGLLRNVRKNRDRTRRMSCDNVSGQIFENSSLIQSDEGRESCISLPTSEKLTPRSRPRKDFVCPITGKLLNDPVTLETGQTYEREAIQEWIKRGNTTCPITRQPLSADSLPKTNYVLKRLITYWKEQHPAFAQEFSCSETPRNSSTRETSLVSNPRRTFYSYSRNSTESHTQQRRKRFVRTAVSTSPTSVISQATIETIVNGLKPYISCLCTSENLEESEAAVSAVAKLWKDSKGDPAVLTYLSEPTFVNGIVEILSASVNSDALKTSIYILSELTFLDESVGEILTSVDYDFACLSALLKNGLAEAVVLIYQLRPAFAQLSAHNFIPSLVQLIQSKSEDLDDLHFAIEPKDAAIAVLEQILTGGDENSRSVSAFAVIHANGIPALVKCLDRVEGRRSIVSILLCCMRADRSCRNLIASTVEPSPVLELFLSGNNNARGLCIDFLSELVHLSRRTTCNQILQIIKEEGAFSTMHTFLVYLQMAPMEHKPSLATLLLQLDLLAEPRKMSIYREEAVEALIEALHRKEFSNSQMMALDALGSLSARRTSSGDPYMETWLLKIAGFDQPYNALMKAEKLTKNENDLAETNLAESMEDEERAESSWEKRVAFVLCNHEKGSIFKALQECFKSNSLETAKSCLVISTWLIYMLSVLPDTGVKSAARESLLEELINVLQSSRNMEDKILSTLALRTFVSDPAALGAFGKYAKCIYRTLRKLKRSSPVVTDVLKSVMKMSSVNATELWNCTEVVEVESCVNGKLLSLLHLEGRVISSHSDGTIKVWDAGKRVLRLIQEVREHTKAVTCLYIPSSGDKLYSGSLDKTIRVWAIKPEEIHCIQVHDVKEAVYELAANDKVACFVSQGPGVKVYSWSDVPKHINFNRTVKCLAMTGDILYCGASGYSIQEVDLSKFTSTTFYSGTRKMLGKQSIYSLHIQDGLLFAGGSAVDGTAGKVFCHTSKAVTGSFPTGFDILRISVNGDFIFTATRSGTIEVWLRERVARVASIKVGGGGHTRVTCLASDMDGGMLYAGTSDGKIQAWALDWWNCYQYPYRLFSENKHVIN